MINLEKVAVAAAVVAVAATGTLFLAPDKVGENKQANNDNGIDVSSTPCEQLGEARQAVDDEYEGRKETAENAYRAAMEAASDAYWQEYRDAEQAKWDCESEALLADPCAEHFERASALAREILDNIDQGYDEAKSAERDRAKADYDECMKNPPEEDTYEGMKAKCAADFQNRVEAAQSTRDTAESAADQARDAALNKAEEAKTAKHATLDAIAEICQIPPPETEVTAGGVTTGGTGTVVEAGNPACTGAFSGYDPEIQAEIDRLQQLLAQARAGGQTSGLMGTNQLSAKITQLRADMAAGDRKCSADTDCGDTAKVCCSDTQVGWVVCADGVCASETEDCGEGEICAGQPAECTSGSEGAESSGIEINRTYIKGATCNPNLQKINLRPKDENSDRFEIVGAVPDWLEFSSVGGKLPQDVTVSIDCTITKTEGTYTGEAKITVYDQGSNLINTIPLLVTIDVVPSILEEDDESMTAGDDTGLSEPGGAAANDPEGVMMPEDEGEDMSESAGAGLTEEEETPTETVQAVNFPDGYVTADQLTEYSAEECDCCDSAHWHAQAGYALTSDGELINDPFSNCGLGRLSEFPVMTIEVPAE